MIASGRSRSITLRHEVGVDGDEVDAVGEVLAGLHGGDVGVDQHHPDALLLERLDRLRAGVVELAGLADLQRAAAEQQDGRGFRVAGMHRAHSSRTGYNRFSAMVAEPGTAWGG